MFSVFSLISVNSYSNDFTIRKIRSKDKICSEGKVSFEINHESWDSRKASCIEWYVNYTPVSGIATPFAVPVELIWKKDVKTRTSGLGYVTNCNSNDGNGPAGNPSQKYSPVEITIPKSAKRIQITVRIYKPGVFSSDNVDEASASFDVDGIREDLGAIVGNGVFDCSVNNFKTAIRSYNINESKILQANNVYVWTAPKGWTFVNFLNVELNQNTLIRLNRPGIVKLKPDSRLGNKLPDTGNLELYATETDCSIKSLVSKLPISYEVATKPTLTQEYLPNSCVVKLSASSTNLSNFMEYNWTGATPQVGNNSFATFLHTGNPQKVSVEARYTCGVSKSVSTTVLPKLNTDPKQSTAKQYYK